LRKLNICAAKMKIYHEKLKANSFQSVLEFVRKNEVRSIPTTVIRAKCKFRTVKVAKKLSHNSSNFVALQNGLGELSSGTLIYIVDALATQADLWGVVNNALAKLTESVRAEKEEEPESEDKQITSLWIYYNKVRGTNLDKLIAGDKYEARKYG
jgi:hypothetical protein